MVDGTCLLCGEYRILRESHIIPKFVGKKLKSLTATGYLRNIKDPDKRAQDLPKLPLLCDDCEQILSKYESYFAEKVFSPFFKNNQSEFSYTTDLLKFVVSVCWRVLKVSYDAFIEDNPEMKNEIIRAEEVWRKFILSEIDSLDPYEGHIFFLDFIDDSSDVLDGFQWYTLTATDTALVGNKERVFSFVKLPWIILVTSICPNKLTDWIHTKIEVGSSSIKPVEIRDAEFGSFLIDRAKMALNKLGKSYDEKILKSLKKDPNRFFTSQSFEIFIVESKRERRRKKELLPESIVALIEIIEDALEKYEPNSIQNREQKFAQKIVADLLANLPMSIASEIHYGILSSISEARDTMQTRSYMFETDKIVCCFLIMFYDSKNKQMKILQITMDKLLEEKEEHDNRIYVVFTFNPLDEKQSFETMLYFE